MSILDIISCVGVFVVFVIIFLHTEKDLNMTPYTGTKGCKKLKIAPYIVGCGDVIYVIMKQLPISRRWVPVIESIAVDYGIIVSFNKYEEALEYIKKHYQNIYSPADSDKLINKLYV